MTDESNAEPRIGDFAWSHASNTLKPITMICPYAGLVYEGPTATETLQHPVYRRIDVECITKREEL